MKLQRGLNQVKKLGMIIFGEHSNETMYALSRRVNISETLLGNYKTGRVTPSLPSARKIAAAINMPLDELLFLGEGIVDKRARQ